MFGTYWHGEALRRRLPLLHKVEHSVRVFHRWFVAVLFFCFEDVALNSTAYVRSGVIDLIVLQKWITQKHKGCDNTLLARAKNLVHDDSAPVLRFD